MPTRTNYSTPQVVWSNGTWGCAKNPNLQKAGQILKLFVDDGIAETEPFNQVRAKAFAILDRGKIETVANHIITRDSFDETAFQWGCIDDLSAQFKRHLRPIVLAVSLNGSPAQSELINALQFFRTAFSKGRKLGSYTIANIPVEIIKSLYLLRYIDSPPLRRNVQKALNRGESYHQLRRAVAYANFGKLRFKTEYEQQIWGECSRLITNCIICYNTTILSCLLDHSQGTGNKVLADRIKSASPIAWQHINFFGRYEFTKQSEPINMEQMIQELAKCVSE